MRKLTAERAQERIAHLKQWQQQRGLTLREEEYLEALEGYLPILEQKERGEDEDEGEWIEWGGALGFPSINRNQWVEVKTFGGVTSPIPASSIPWSDVIAYRIIPEGQR